MIENRQAQAGEGAAGEQGSENDVGRLKPPPAPRYEDLERSAMRRSSRAGQTLSSFDVKLKVVTPILGGAAVTRTIDDVDVIRVPTVRGHLRFWWRALYGHEPQYDTPAKLFEAEGKLWGRAANEDGEDGRSPVEVLVEVIGTTLTEHDACDPLHAPGAYALWPARGARGESHVRRRQPGTEFRLTLVAPECRMQELRNVVRAWILFGGYGSRTRRGLGSLTVIENADEWLPKSATRDEFTRLFARDVFAAASRPTQETPWLANAALLVGTVQTGNNAAERAWTTALDWLKEFRQGTNSGARQSGAGKVQPNRPSISNWPEADAVRRIGTAAGGGPYAHYPRTGYGPGRAWPRAGFGLPLVGQFQRQARGGGSYQEPANFELRWHDGTKERDRLASTLFVKALPLVTGSFVPCVLWLNRAYPAGQVVMKGSMPVSTGATFNARYSVPAGVPQFVRDAGTGSMRDAFLDWLDGTTTGSTRKATRIAP